MNWPLVLVNHLNGAREARVQPFDQVIAVEGVLEAYITSVDEMVQNDSLVPLARDDQMW